MRLTYSSLAKFPDFLLRRTADEMEIALIAVINLKMAKLRCDRTTSTWPIIFHTPHSIIFERAHPLRFQAPITPSSTKLFRHESPKYLLITPSWTSIHHGSRLQVSPRTAATSQSVLLQAGILSHSFPSFWTIVLLHLIQIRIDGACFLGTYAQQTTTYST